ncbi:ClpX C4-type zinc finger protein [Collimonas fungivorans]|nr:ClpX C4-type zinc finger protein [Collimonas fungivorans]
MDGRQVLYVDGKLLGPVPRLAICRNLFGELQDFLIMHCDNRWNVLGVGGAATLRESMQRSEHWYEGISQRWVRTHTTKRIAERWLRTQCAGEACSMCRKIPAEVDGMFSKGIVNICFLCIRQMHQSIVDSEINR